MHFSLSLALCLSEPFRVSSPVPRHAAIISGSPESALLHAANVCVRGGLIVRRGNRLRNYLMNAACTRGPLTSLAPRAALCARDNNPGVNFPLAHSSRPASGASRLFDPTVVTPKLRFARVRIITCVNKR